MSKRRLLLALLVLTACGFGVMAWLLVSGGGRDWALDRLRAQLPADALTIGRAEGRLLGPLQLHDLRYRDAGLELQIDSVQVSYRSVGLLMARLDVETLTLHGVRLRLAEVASDAPVEPIQLPSRLPWPRVDLPLDLLLRQLSIRELQVAQGEAQILTDATVEGVDLDLRSGGLRIGDLQLISPQLGLSLRGEMGLSGQPSAAMTAEVTQPQSAARASLQVTTKDETLLMQLTLDQGGELRLGLSPQLDWQLVTDVAIEDSARWLPQAPSKAFVLQLQGQGSARTASLSGQLTLDGQTLAIETAELALDDAAGRLDIAALRLTSPAYGALAVSGRMALQPELTLDLTALLDELRLAADAEVSALAIVGTLRAQGPLDALQLGIEQAQVSRDGRTAALSLAAELQGEALQLDQLRMASGASTLEVDGRIDWQSALQTALAIRVRDFDPALLAPEWPGALSGEVAIATRDAGAHTSLELQLSELSGSLRERQVRGGGTLRMEGGSGSADVTLEIGESRLSLQGNPGDILDLRLALAPLQVNDVLPDASGRIEGELGLSGGRAKARVRGRLQGRDLRWGGDGAEGDGIQALTLDVDSAIDGRQPGQLILEASGLALAGQVIDLLRADLRGERDTHVLRLVVEGEQAHAELSLSGSLGETARGPTWRGALDQLALSANGALAMRLQEPATLAWSEAGIALAPMCLRATVGQADVAAEKSPTQLCLDARHGREGQALSAELSALELGALAQALGNKTLQLEGEVGARLNVTLPSSGPPQGSLRLSLPAGQLAQAELGERRLLGWQAVVVEIDLDATAFAARIHGQVNERGSILGVLSSANPWQSPEAALEGNLRLVLPDIAALELLVPELAAVSGQLDARLGLGGQWQAPLLNGGLELSGLGAELPALGIRARDSMLSLRGEAGHFEVDGLLDTGAGALRLSGVLDDPFDGAPTFDMQLAGERVRLANTPQFNVLASPTLRLRLANNRLRVTGKLEVPEAKIAIDALDGAVAPSRDVVVLDPRGEQGVAGALDVRANIDVVLGEKVELRGFGFDGGISGSLQINERSGRVAIGRGALTLRGNYRAYGQDLEIQRGRLLFASSPLDDPGIDLRAQRKLSTVTAGITVTGSARQPQLDVWSEPVLDQAEALSYLVLGRPLRSATAAEGSQLAQAAAAFGGNLLGEKLGSRLGFDTFGVADSQALGGAAFTVGKYLSPALYLSYGVSLFGTGQVVTLRYLLSAAFDIEIESGVESRAGVNYRIER